MQQTKFLMDVKVFLDQFKYERDFKKVAQLLKENSGFEIKLLKLVEEKASYPYAEYASWIWTHICKDLPEIAQLYYKNLLNILFETNNETVLRNILAGILNLKKTAFKESEFINLLFQFLSNKSHKVALHVYSIYNLIDFVKKYPELKQELSLCLEILSENSSPALNVAIRKFKQTKFDLKN